MTRPVFVVLIHSKVVDSFVLKSIANFCNGLSFCLSWCHDTQQSGIVDCIIYWYLPCLLVRKAVKICEHFLLKIGLKGLLKCHAHAWDYFEYKFVERIRRVHKMPYTWNLKDEMFIAKWGTYFDIPYYIKNDSSKYSFRMEANSATAPLRKRRTFYFKK